MRKRTVTSIVLILIPVITIFLLPVWTFSVIASLFIAMGLYEFFKLDSKNKFPPSFIYLGIFSGVLLPYIMYLYRPAGGMWEALFFITVFIALFIIQFTRRENQNAVAFIALTLFGIFYIGWFFTFLVKIRFLAEGHKLVAFLLLVTKAGDVGAYLVGTRFGRHKLLSRISPKKSIEGAVGGFLFSLFFACISKIYLGWMSFGAIFMAGVLIGIFAQFGDFAESLVKRDYQVKDSSPFLPGLGGLLDVIDSVLFAAPVFYIYLTIIM
ncbi:MAG: phosphatidate cytidylyltransferase [Candidatus Omnitrophica bacterium]|nr:phosphatidate cytidylyltransferase [Candidatus Omnitrophota bacterium]MBU1933227.1 phosphatidate cytidylyltransferase [Candidatus Omnitrophota bacterium]